MDPRREDAIHNERHVKVICVGAGASGLCLAYKLQRSFKSYSLTIYEKNPDISGTWYENRYPGCACDVPSHNYVYSFEPKPDWSSVYAGSSEIRSYFRDFASKYGLWKYIKTSHTVTATRWNETEGMWEVEATDLATGQTVRDSCHILVHATGYLNNLAWPKIPGLDAYTGSKLHSADYDDSVSLHGKDVLLIGGGSSAVQILPAVQPIAKSVKIFIRSPVWVLPDISNDAGQYSQEEIDKFVSDAESVQALRQNNERTMNSIFTVYLKDSFLQKQCQELLVFETKKILQDKDMEDKLIPDFPVGCKRVIPSGYKYLRALKKENVTVVHGGVTSFTKSGCMSDDGQTHEGEVIICATGFNTSYIPRYPIVGPDGRNLQDEWAESIMGYMGVGVSEFPNTFTMLGPYTPVSNGPTVIAIEAQADYICSFIDRYQTEPIHSVALKQAACADFKAQVASFMDKAVWTGGCRNSHNNYSINGRTPTTWPGSTLHYLEAMREPRFDDWAIKHSGNRFSWLGIGVSQAEWDPTSDLGYYIRQADDGHWSSRWKRNLAIAKTGSMPARQLHRQPKLALYNGDSDSKAITIKGDSPAGNIPRQIGALLSSLSRMLNSVLPRFLTGRFYTSPSLALQHGLDTAQYSSSPAAQSHINRRTQEPLDYHSQYWQQTAGNMLSILLREAGYSDDSQALTLRFFNRTIIPSLGAALDKTGDGAPKWKSFMTDDHNPIELSWDWNTGEKRPTIRFSMEPVGVSAGKADPDNKLADPMFREALSRVLPTTNMELFNHFDRELNQSQSSGIGNAPGGHPSQIFYAFDLGEDEVTSKTYFFPGFMAKETNRTVLQVLSQTIRTAPGCSDKLLLEALTNFEDFVNDESTPPLEMDMLAIDMVEPARSRLKIYFRNRETSFASVRQMMTLGNRASDPCLERGLQNLRKIWNAVLLQDGVADDVELPALQHRTGGMLYNIELRPGSKSPKLKIYIPARHYGKNDGQIVTALHEYMYGINGQSKDTVMPNFPSTLRKIFNEDALQDERGIQTYVGCSMQQGGDLRLVSYLNPQSRKFRTEK